MKKLFSTTRVAAFCFAVILTAASAVPALANDDERKKPELAIPVELKYVGKSGDSIVFDLVFNSPEESEFTITIRDQSNYVWHKKKAKGGNYTKRFLLTLEDRNDISFWFVIKDRKSEQPVVYRIDKASIRVENLEVSKIN
jgi:hypothetical protein